MTLERGAEEAFLEALVAARAVGMEGSILSELECERILALLPPGLREVLVLRDVHGYPHRAIAARLGISVAASEQRVSRARARLRACLGDEEADG